MGKKTIGYILFLLIIIFNWLFFVGQLNGISGIKGDINFIDEGQYAAWIFQMIHGKIPYQDIYIQYAPLQFFPTYYIVTLFGQSFFYIRFMHIIGIFLGIVAAFWVMKEIKINPVIRAILVIILVVIPGVHIRHWIGIVFLILGVKIIHNPSKVKTVAFGILSGIIFLQSIEVGIFSLFIFILYSIYTFFTSKIRDKVKLCWKYGSIGLFLCILVFSYYGYRQGWFIDFLLVQSEFIVSASGIQLPNGQGLPVIELQFSFAKQDILKSIIILFINKLLLFYFSFILLTLFINVIVMKYLLKRNRKEDEMVLLILVFIFVTYISIIGRSGHYPVIISMISICGGYFYMQLFESISLRKKSELFFICVISFLSCLYIIRHGMIYRTNFNPYQLSVSNNIRVSPLQISTTQNENILLLQKFIWKYSSNNESIFVFNNSPALYFLLMRVNATRYDLPLLVNTAEKRIQLLKELTEKKPKFIIQDTNAWDVDGVSDIRRLGEIYDFIKNNYKIKSQIGQYIVYSL